MAYEMDVVDDNLISNLFNCNCMLSIGGRPIMITT
jgi:hypothetical protein